MVCEPCWVSPSGQIVEIKPYSHDIVAEYICRDKKYHIRENETADDSLLYYGWVRICIDPFTEDWKFYYIKELSREQERILDEYLGR